MKYSVLIVVACAAIIASAYLPSAGARPADFTGRYEILQSRTLALTAPGRGYVLQDGRLVAQTSIDSSRVYCRSAQTKFDESSGFINVSFTTAADGSEIAVLTTVPGRATASVTTIECFAPGGFSGVLDLAVALGRVVTLAR